MPAGQVLANLNPTSNLLHQLDPTSSSVRRKFGPACMIFCTSIHFHYHDADADADAEDGQDITTWLCKLPSLARPYCVSCLHVLLPSVTSPSGALYISLPWCRPWPAARMRRLSTPHRSRPSPTDQGSQRPRAFSRFSTRTPQTESPP